MIASLVSVATITPARAANNAAIGAANAATAASTMNVASLLADPAVSNTVTTGNLRSNGLLRLGTAVNTTGSAVMLSTGTVTVYLTGVTDGGSTIVIENGTTASAKSAVTAGATRVVNAAGTRIVMVDDSAATVMAAGISPDAGVSLMTISYYQKAAVTAVDDGSTETAAATTLSTAAVADLGTLTTKVTVRVLPASSFLTLSGTYCQVFENGTVTDLSISYQLGSANSMVVPAGSTFTVTSTTAGDVVFATSPGIITASTNSGAADGLSAPLTTADSSSATIKSNSVGTYTLRLTASGAPTVTTDSIVITVVASCAAGTFSVNNSFIENQAPGAVSVANDNVDDTPFWTNGQTAVISMRIRNGYVDDVPASTWVVSATNGALVGITSGGNTTAPTCGVTSTASVTGTGGDIKVGICQGTDYAAQLSTVTVTYGSTTVLTKTILITGDVAKIDVNTVETGKTGTVNFRTFKASAYDAAGNRVAVNPSADASTLDQNVTAADIGTTSVAADVQDDNTFTCGTGAKGSTNVVFQVTAASGATVKSAPVKLTCASSTYTYTAALDKAVYVPGDIATLTITAKDVNGAAPFDSHKTASTGAADDTFNYVNGSNVIPSISGSQMTPVAALAAADEFAGGVKKYTFIVGSTEGSYQMAVNLTGIATDTAKTVAYQVKSSSTTVTNAEVLASIVKLIASINKQIRALQKSLRR